MAALLTVATDDVSARLAILEDGVTFMAPITYKGHVVCSEGQWTYGVDAANPTHLGDALENCFVHIVRSMGLTLGAIEHAAARG